MPAVACDMLMGAFSLENLLELYKTVGTGAMAFRTGQAEQILFPLGIQGLPRREIGLAVTKQTLAENIDFDFYGPPLVIKEKKPALIAGVVPAPAGHRRFN